MTKQKTTFPLSFTVDEREKLIQLLDEIRSDVQYIRLIVAGHPYAKVVREVRQLIKKAENKN
jgi:hypothetical protein